MVFAREGQRTHEFVKYPIRKSAVNRAFWIDCCCRREKVGRRADFLNTPILNSDGESGTGSVHDRES